MTTLRTAVNDRAAWYRPELNQETLILLFAVALTVCFNSMFWEQALLGRSALSLRTGWFVLATGASIACIHFLLLALVCTARTIKIWLAVIWLLSALAWFYMSRYSVYLDADMLRNVMHTQSKEAFELLTPSSVLAVVGLSVPALLLLLFVRVRPRPWLRGVFRRTVGLVLAFAVALSGILSVYPQLSSLMRNEPQLRYLVTPANLIVGTWRVGASQFKQAQQPRLAIGLDAVQHGRAERRPRLLLLMVGETVRAANWGLNGYSRQTTPELANIDLVNFPDVSACGSNTEVSVPCLFAPVGRREYRESTIRGQDSLLHLLDRVGVQSLWLDNQTGCKGVCTGLAFESIRGDEDPALCDGEVCLDQVLVDRVRGFLASGEGAVDAVSDQIIVLHPLGNHGPSYSRRYPAAFRRFVPTCEKADLSACSMEEIGNSYDNAIGYTDHLLAELIGMLDRQSTYDAALLYVSDHGESLGERGLYLHGLPYSLAPSEQLKVPMALWTSDALTSSMVVDQACLRQESRQSLTHDNVFHSVMGLFDVSSVVYAPELDLLARCRSATPAGSLAGRGGAALLAPRAAQVHVADGGQQGR